MSLFQIEQLSRENKQLKDKLTQSQNTIKCLKNDSEAYAELFQKHQNQKKNLQQQIRQLKRREEEKHYEREDMENRYLNVLKKMEDELDDRKKKYQKLEGKIEPLLNHDTVRLKILNEVEAAHQLQMDQFKRSIQSLKDEVLRLKRQNQLLKHRGETQKMDYQENMRKLKMKLDERVSGDHFNETTYEMCMQIQGRLRMNYEQARKESDYYKEKYFSNEKRHQQKISLLEREVYLLKQKVNEGGI